MAAPCCCFCLVEEGQETVSHHLSVSLACEILWRPGSFPFASKDPAEEGARDTADCAPNLREVSQGLVPTGHEPSGQLSVKHCKDWHEKAQSMVDRWTHYPMGPSRQTR